MDWKIRENFEIGRTVGRAESEEISNLEGEDRENWDRVPVSSSL